VRYDTIWEERQELVWLVCSTSTILGTNGLNSADVPLSNKEPIIPTFILPFPFSHDQTITIFSVSIHPVLFSSHISLPPLHWRSCPAISLSPCISTFFITTFQDVFKCPCLCTIHHNWPNTTLINIAYYVVRHIDESKITPRLREESVGVIVSLEGMSRVGWQPC